MYQLKVLIADDDLEIVNLIADSLEDEGFEVYKAHNGVEAVEYVANQEFSLIILDIMMPGMDGLEVCRKIREKIATPIILLSAKSRELDKIIGLEVGADDYIAKPFSIHELVARVKAHIRREKRNKSNNVNQQSVIALGDLSIHTDCYEVYKGSKKIELSTKEFQILLYFIQNKNIVLSREQIYQAIWGGNEFGDISTVTVHITNLRKKFDPENKYIKTVWGAGYKLIGGVS